MLTPAKDILTRLMMAACLLIAAAQAARAQETSFRTYKDVSGFSCEFPSDWSFDQAKNLDRIFTSANARHVTIIVQVIDRQLTAEKTAVAQLQMLRAKLLEVPDGRILNEATAPIAAQQAPYLIAGYTTSDSAGQVRPFRHIQMVVTAPRVFLLMSYSAPDEIFDEHMRVFQNCAATLVLEDPATPPAGATTDGADDTDATENAETDDDAPVDPGPGSEDTLIWRHNTDRDFWIAVPSIWSNKTDQSEPYSVDMQHPDRVEGVLVFVVDLGKSSTVKDYANAWELVLADKIFFMKDRLAVPEASHPGVGLAKTPGILREYQGEISGATVRSVAAYVVNKKRAFTVVGFHFLGDATGEKRIRAAVESFRLSAP
ncbi:MAG: hypothetical protein Q8O63_13745 [Hoeflea sp.]|nr:hypothetical protein [Hoeflea sp.]